MEEIESAESTSSAPVNPSELMQMVDNGGEKAIESAVPVDKSVCEQCEEKKAGFVCKDCNTGMRVCEDCFKLLHKSSKKKSHVKEPIAGPKVEAVQKVNPAESIPVCEQCEEGRAELRCQDCERCGCGYIV